MVKRFLLLFLVAVGFVGMIAQVHTASIGNTSTYLSLVSTAPPTPTPTPAPLPNEPLLLIQDDPITSLAWVNATGTFRRDLTTNTGSGFSRISPDGNTILYYEQGNGSSRHLLLDAEGGTPHEIPIYLDNRQWSADSRYISYGNQTSLPNQLYTYDVSTEITHTLAVNSYESRWHPQTGQFYYQLILDMDAPDNAIYRINGDGTGNSLVYASPDTEGIAAILPDGRLVLSIRSDSRFDLALINPDGTGYAPLTSLPLTTRVVYVSPYGNAIFYEDNANDTVYLKTREGILIRDFAPSCDAPYTMCDMVSASWHPQNREIAFVWSQRTDNSDSRYSLYTMKLDGTAPQLVATEQVIGPAFYSPDGLYLALDFGSTIVIRDVVTQTITYTFSRQGDPNIEGWRPLP